MLKILLIAGGAALALGLAGGLLAWHWMTRPLYAPGMVRAETALRAPLAPPAQADDPSFWLVEPDVRLFHFAAGTGRPVLVVHGGPGIPAVEPWPGLAPLTSRYRFVYYDQRGSGRSTRPIDRFATRQYVDNVRQLDQTLGLQAQIADIERIRRILGEERLILVGHSFGGFLASLYAAEFPERVEALVLIAPADVLVMPSERGGLFAAVRARLPEADRAGYDAWLRRYLDYGSLFARSEEELAAAADEFGAYYALATGEPTPPQAASGGWVAHAMYLSMGQRHDYRAALRGVTAPVLVVHGGDDLQPVEASRLYAEAFPEARLQLIERAGHFPHQSQPDAFAAVVDEFLAEIGERRAAAAP